MEIMKLLSKILKISYLLPIFLCIIFWALLAILRDNYSLFGIDSTYFFHAGKSIFTIPLDMYKPGFYYLPVFAFLISPITLLPFEIYEWEKGIDLRKEGYCEDSISGFIVMELNKDCNELWVNIACCEPDCDETKLMREQLKLILKKLRRGLSDANSPPTLKKMWFTALIARRTPSLKSVIFSMP